MVTVFFTRIYPNVLTFNSRARESAARRKERLSQRRIRLAEARAFHEDDLLTEFDAGVRLAEERYVEDMQLSFLELTTLKKTCHVSQEPDRARSNDTPFHASFYISYRPALPSGLTLYYRRCAVAHSDARE